MNDFTAQLRAKGWTQDTVAKRWNVSQPTVSRWSRNPAPHHLDALAGLPDLLDIDDECETLENLRKATTFAEACRAYMGIPEEKRIKMKAEMDYLLSPDGRTDTQ